MMKDLQKNQQPNFADGFRIYMQTPPPTKRTQKFPWGDIPVGGVGEIEANIWPAETKRNAKGSSNVAASAYQWASKHGLKFQAEHLAGGNVKIYNRGEK